METVSITFTGRLTTQVEVWIAYVGEDANVHAQELSSFPYTFTVAKGTLLSISGYSPSSGTFGYPILTVNSKEAAPVFSVDSSPKYFIAYAVTAKEDSTCAIFN